MCQLIFIMKRSAQLKLQDSHLVLVDFDSALCDEIVKNVALAGIGRITILRDKNNQSRTRKSLRLNESLADYAKNLNPHIEVIYNID